MSERKGWPELGIITKNPVLKRNENGEAIKDSNGNYEYVTDQNGQVIYKLGFQLADGVTILVDGQPVALNKKRTGILKSPVKEVEELYKRGAINDNDIEGRREKAKEINTWLRYKVQLPPPRD